MDLLHLQLRGILDGHDTLAAVDVRRHGVEQRRLATARTARDQRVTARPNDTFQQVRKLAREGSQLYQAVHVDRHPRKLADREQRAVHRQGRDDCVDARAIRQTGVDHGLRFVDPPSNG